MNRTSCAVVLSVLVVTLSAPALAQDATARKVTLDLNGVEPLAAFRAVAAAIDVGVTVSPSVTDPVNIAVRNVTARTALNAMCESVGCRWTLTDGILVVKPVRDSAAETQYRVRVEGTATTPEGQAILEAFKRKLPSHMTFDNAPLGEVSRRLTESVGLPVKLVCKDPDVKTLTMDLSGLTLASALEAIGEAEDRASASWQLTVGPAAGGSKSGGIAIMVGPKKAKKTVTKR
ncbi:MAG: hypothetical protein MUE61_10715 [Vicinamibacterales bacterium]|jgi:hypothetical protein|nr:hypothetical protein [Vicinamibacterales bacterium]